MKRAGMLSLASAVLLTQASSDKNAGDVYHPASISAIQGLFNLAVSRPDKCHFVADIELIRPPGNREQIEAQLNLEKELFNNRDERLSVAKRQQLDAARSNAVVRAMSGKRIQHLEEWYSGHYNRLDETDEGLVSADYLKSNHGRFHDTFVNVHDTNFYPYTSLCINHELRDVDVSKAPDKYFRMPNDLWRVVGLDMQLSAPLMVMLLGFRSLDTNLLASLNKQDADVLVNYVRADSIKVQQLHEGVLPNWHLKVRGEVLRAVNVERFQLDGQYHAPEAPMQLSSIQATYWIGQIAGRLVCMQAAISNMTLHTYFFSERDDFDGAGFPHVWNSSTIIDGTESQFNIRFKLVDILPDFKDAEVFALAFPTNYFVSDMTSGKTKILQQPNPQFQIVGSPLPGVITNHSSNVLRVFILTALLLPLAAIFIFTFCKSHSK